MKVHSSEIRTSVLQRELRWFVTNRWAAGLIVAIGGGLGETWLGGSSGSAPMVAIGAGILLYNAVLWNLLKNEDADADPRPIRFLALAWVQLLLDFISLTLLTILTGGEASPVLGLFILHMVFASTLLSKRSSYLAAAFAIALVFFGLFVSHSWKNTDQEIQIMLGWMAMLILTVYLTNHITSTRRKRDTLLRRQHRQISAIVETAPDGIISFTEDGKIISANTSAERMFGFQPRTLVGIHIHQLMPLEFEKLLQQNSDLPSDHHQGLTAPSFVDGNLLCRRTDGSQFPGGAAVTVVRLGRQLLFTTIVRDISSHREAERKLHDLNEQLKLQQAAMIQHEKMVAVGRMAAGVAHEIANPLSNIDSVIQLAERRSKPVSPEQCRLLSEQVKRISSIIKNLKGFAHPEETEFAFCSAKDLIEQSLSMIQFDRRHRFVHLNESRINRSCIIRVQPESMQQVFVNILVNALDAVEDVSDPQVSISVERTEDQLCRIAFRDNGQGIAPENIRHVFDPFFTTKPLGQGTGLGLSICQQLVSKQGGRIEIQSTDSQGTIVSVLLPIARSAISAASDPAKPHSCS